MRILSRSRRFPRLRRCCLNYSGRTNAEKTRDVYPDYEQLVQDIAAAYRTVIRELYEAGCRNIQLDDCTWGMVVDSEYWEKKLGAGADIEEEARKISSDQ